MDTVTTEQNTAITQAWQRMRLRKGEVDRPPVQWRYFQACDDFQETGEPRQWFVVCSHDELRLIRDSNIIRAGIQTAKLLQRRRRGPGVEGWYVQSKSADGSNTWFLLGIDTDVVVAYYDSL